MKKRSTRFGLGLFAALACFVAMATPASATIHSYNVELVSGRISVGSQTFDTPGVGIATCPAGTTINGTINDAGGTDTITGNLAISSPFVLPVFGGNYVLTASGAATGTNAGNYNPANGTFTNLSFPTISFSIRSFNATTCTPGAVVCSGTASLTASGGLYNGATLPLVNPESVYVNATGSITSRSSCSFPFSFFISVGAVLSIGDNPNDDYPPVGSADPGAIFEQL